MCGRYFYLHIGLCQAAMCFFVDNTYCSYLTIMNSEHIQYTLCYTTRLHPPKNYYTVRYAMKVTQKKSSSPWLQNIQNIFRSRGHGQLRADHPAAARRGAGSPGGAGAHLGVLPRTFGGVMTSLEKHGGTVWNPKMPSENGKKRCKT